MNSAETGANNVDRRAANTADVLVGGWREGGEQRGIVDDHSVGTGIDDEGATVSVADKAEGKRREGKGMWGGSLS